MAHPFPPPPPPLATAATAPVVPSATPPQQVPSVSHSDEDDPSEAMSFSPSTAPSDGYAPADASITNGFLSLESI